MSQDGNVKGKQFWESIWKGLKRGEAFDRVSVLPELRRQVEQGLLQKGGRALVPGCGRGYDVELFSQSGLFKQVVGMDISDRGASEARVYLNSVKPKLDVNWEIKCVDFFEVIADDNFSLVYDLTFFCAIPVERRKEWGARMKDLVEKGGNLITVMFPLGKSLDKGGPPYGMKMETYVDILEGAGGFERRDGPRLLDDSAAHAGWEGKMGWCRWERL